MIQQGDVMEPSPCSSSFTEARARNLTGAEPRNAFQRCRIDELATQICKQNRVKTLRRLHEPLSGMTPFEALQFIKARGLTTIDPLPAHNFNFAPSRPTYDVSFAIKRRQPVSRLPRYVVRSRGDPLIKSFSSTYTPLSSNCPPVTLQEAVTNAVPVKCYSDTLQIGANQWNEGYKGGEGSEASAVHPCKPTYRIIRRGKCIHGITIYPSLAMVIHPPQYIAPFESGDEHCDLCETVSKIAEMTQTSSSDLTSPPLRSISRLTPILETKPCYKISNSTCPQSQQQQGQQNVFNFEKGKDADNEATCTPIVDASNSTCDRNFADATRPHIGSDEAAPVSSVVAAGATETLQVTVPSCKTTSEVTLRQSAYKEPNEHQVHKKVRLAILIHPAATPTTCVGTKREIVTPYHSSTTNSFSESLTNCSRSVTTFSTGSDNLMPNLDSCILDDQLTDVSEIYDAAANEGGEFKKGFISYREREGKEKQEMEFDEKKIQNTLTHITPPPCLSPISECSLSTTSPGLLGQKKGQNGRNLLFKGNDSPEVNAIANSALHPNTTTIERLLGDGNAFTGPQGVSKNVLMPKLLEPPKPETKVTSSYARTSCLNPINPYSGDVSNIKLGKIEKKGLNEKIEPLQTIFAVGVEGAASLEPIIHTLQESDEVLVEVANISSSVHRTPRSLSPAHHLHNSQKSVPLGELKSLKWVLKRANVTTTEMNAVVMHAAPSILQCTKHRLPKMEEVDDTAVHCVDRIPSESLNSYNIGTSRTPTPRW
ncbi:unnamed protein product [Hydatigera taeniaeformis]|uniref:RPEL repeat protein n=1 Tax=Hydatigena taeniaeformis TaxID=6205 RepID=A0A0R3X507_HYDTA|nr:unnamed protein product [Hydatigera taeniaeformis]